MRTSTTNAEIMVYFEDNLQITTGILSSRDYVGVNSQPTLLVVRSSAKQPNSFPAQLIHVAA